MLCWYCVRVEVVLSFGVFEIAYVFVRCVFEVAYLCYGVLLRLVIVVISWF